MKLKTFWKFVHKIKSFSLTRSKNSIAWSDDQNVFNKLFAF